MKFRYLAGLATLSLGLPATADTLYSGLLDTVISTDFDGVTVTIDGGTLNPFFGGVGVANNNLLQPLRNGTGDLDTLLNLSAGTVIDAGSQFLSTGFGGSQDHLGSTFTSGQEGYIGFKLNDANYGWVRVVFTNNTGGALIKDWAYDNSGAAIATGNVLQEGSTVTLDSSSGSFTLGSQLTGSVGVVKTGAGITTLSGINTYTGATSVSAGTLLVTGALGDTALTVQNGAAVGGNGSLGGSLEFFAGAQLDVTGATLGLNSTDILSVASGKTMIFNDFGFANLIGWDGANAEEGIYTLIGGGGTVTLSGTTPTALNPFHFGNGKSGYFQEGSFQAVIIPEPRTAAALIGGLGLLMLLRRRSA